MGWRSAPSALHVMVLFALLATIFHIYSQLPDLGVNRFFTYLLIPIGIYAVPNIAFSLGIESLWAHAAGVIADVVLWPFIIKDGKQYLSEQ